VCPGLIRIKPASQSEVVRVRFTSCTSATVDVARHPYIRYHSRRDVRPQLHVTANPAASRRRLHALYITGGPRAAPRKGPPRRMSSIKPGSPQAGRGHCGRRPSPRPCFPRPPKRQKFPSPQARPQQRTCFPSNPFIIPAKNLSAMRRATIP